MKSSDYDDKYFFGLEKADLGELPRNLRVLEEIEYFKKGGKLLDVGFGTGLFIKLAEKSGWETVGIDISEYAAKRATKVLKLRILKTDLISSKFAKSSFDVINMRHTIEHIKKDKETLEKAFKLLKKGGVISISTPNSFGVHAKIFKDNWPHWSKPYHVNFYSEHSLKKLLEKVGFKILKSKTEEITIYNSLKGVVNKLGLDFDYKTPSVLSIKFDKLLAALGFGEGLLILAKKP